MDLLKDERWDVATLWLEIKFILKTAGGDACKKLFIEHSSRSNNFNQVEVESKWDVVWG